MQPQVITTGGGAYVGGDVHAQAFAGRDLIVNVFTGRYARLKDLYRTPDHIYADVDVAGFVGREKVLCALDQFLHGNASGAFVIEGEAGLGKTSLLARLACTRGYPHLFGQDFTGVDGRIAAAQSLAAQLISTYALEGYGETINPDQAGTATFLTNVINQAARGLRDGRKIVIVCDALDQAAPPTDGQNVFGLPKHLPDGAYLVVTQRPVRVAFECEPSELYVLEAEGDENLRDIRGYLEQRAREPRIAEQLASHQPAYEAEEFVGRLVEKSGGNWMYLRHVLHEIRRGNYHPFDLDALPQGLTRYYLGHWRKWMGGGLGAGMRAWRDLYGPTLGLLAAAQTPLRARALKEWGELAVDEEDLRQLLTVDWAAYVSRLPDDTFQFFHPSLARLMRNETEPGEVAGLRREEQELLRAFGRGAANAHRRIVDHFRAQCGGVWTELAGDPYPWRYIAVHLAGAGMTPELFGLISPEWWQARREHGSNGYGYFQSDVAAALACAERLIHASSDSPPPTSAIAGTIRLGLVRASLRSMSAQLPSGLLAQATAERFMDAEEAIDMAAQMPELRDRIAAYQKLLSAGALSADQVKYARRKLQRAEADGEGIAAGPQVAVTPEQIRQAMQAEDLAAIAAALEAVLADYSLNAERTRGLFLYSPSPVQSELLRAVSHAFRRSGPLARSLFPAVNWLAMQTQPRLDRREEWERALARATSLTFDATLASHHMPQAVAMLRTMRDQPCRAAMLTALAPFGRAPWTEELLENVLSLKDSAVQLEALDRLAPNLRGIMLDRAIHRARELWDDLPERFNALCACIPLLSPEIQRESLERAVAAALELPGSIVCPKLAALAGLMPDELRRRAIHEALAATSRSTHSYGLSQLIQARSLSEIEPVMERDDREQARRRVKTLLTSLHDAEEPALFQPALVLLSPYLDNAELMQWPWYSAQDALRTMSQAAAEPVAQVAAAARESALLALTARINPDHFRAMALLGVAPRLSEASLGPALDIAASIAYYPSGRCDALVALAPRLSGGLLAKALAIADGLDDGVLRRRARIALAARQDTRERRTCLEEALEHASEISEPVSRTALLSALGQADARWLRAQGGRLLPLAIDLLLASAQRGRKTAADCLAALAPLLFALAPEIADDAARALIDVGWSWAWS